MRQGALRFSFRNPMWVSAAPTQRRIEKCGALGAILGFIVTLPRRISSERTRTPC